MSSFILKIIAVISMLFDHMGYIIFDKFTFMNYLGRLAFPIFAFSITEGYSRTSNLKKYFRRLFIFALISQIPYILFTHTFSNSTSLNILFTLCLGLLAITLYEKENNKFLRIVYVLICCITAYLFSYDYGWFGVAVIFIFHKFKSKKIVMNSLFIIATFIYYFYEFLLHQKIEYLWIIVFACLSLIPINLYNEKKGRNIKYFLYIFYPVHLILLYLLNFII